MDDDIIDKAPSHPVTTTLLIVCSVALIIAIGLTGSELGRYINKSTHDQLNGYKLTAVEYFQTNPAFGGTAPEAGAGEGEETPAPRRHDAAPAAPAEAGAPEGAPAPAKDGGSTGASSDGASAGASTGDSAGGDK